MTLSRLKHALRNDMVDTIANSREIAQEPVQTPAEPQHTHAPNGSHHQRVTIYRRVKGPDGKELLVRKASIEDAERQNVPTNYCLDMWDPTERPVILLGSVFDIMSLGKWILDWTIAVHGEGSDPTDIAKDLWTLIIQLASRVKQSEDFVSQHSMKQNSRRRDKVIHIVYGCAEAGKQLIKDFQQLVMDCEERMLETWGLNTIGKAGPNIDPVIVFGAIYDACSVQKFILGFIKEHLGLDDPERDPQNDDAEFVHNESAEYAQACGQPVPPQYSTPSAPWPSPQINGRTIIPQLNFTDNRIQLSISQCIPMMDFNTQDSPTEDLLKGDLPAFNLLLCLNNLSRPTFHGSFTEQMDGTIVVQNKTALLPNILDTDGDNLNTNQSPTPTSQESRVVTGTGTMLLDLGKAAPTSLHRAMKTRVPATSEDAEKHNIPLDYNLEEWDPDENPITLLGAVFDANSVGKWIHGWTHYKYGHLATETEKSGELWSLIILLTRKLRVSAKFISESVGIESVEQGVGKDMVEDFIESGQRRMEKFQTHLKKCEKSMLVSENKGKNKGTVRLRSDAGVAFAEAAFSSKKHFAKTNGLIQSIELWLKRWDANCAIVVGVNPDTKQPTDDVVDGDRDSVHQAESAVL
ncbi:hypothetical protein INS49_010556 [Diaporthe citri]|uniref:uncharacterized protein n=1 Tax=Diaporthe citri TaxID=83186 RepID=UPI001C7FB880|nr:uncharacterized protein INS49_010556 [Diaporthe citri]KAG6362326.1 hypothetical protein INS49_010556 [Diaporthe citri]